MLATPWGEQRAPDLARMEAARELPLEDPTPAPAEKRLRCDECGAVLAAGQTEQAWEMVLRYEEPFLQWAIERDWLPALEKFKPQLIFISAGFDAHTDDPLGDIHLKEEDFTWVTNLIVAAARQHCEGRIISTLEGGYNLNALARSVAAHLKALAS